MVSVRSCSFCRGSYEYHYVTFNIPLTVYWYMYMYQQKLLFWQEISLSKHINIFYISVGCRITTIYTFPFEKINHWHIIWQIIFVTFFVIFHLFIKLPGFLGDFLQNYQCSYFVCIFILFKNYHPKYFDISERRKC